MNNRLAARRSFFCILILGLVVCVGCGGGDNMAEVFGTVQFEGKPIETGAVSFYPSDGKSPSAGGTIKDGKYSARVPLGLAKVVFHGSKIVGKKKMYDTPNSPIMDIYQEVLPAKYSQQGLIEYEVKPGKNEKNWELAK